MKKAYIGTAVIACLLCFARAAHTQCTQLMDERVDYDVSAESQAIHSKRIEYAKAVINDNDCISAQQECVARALFFLGEFKVDKTIPRIIELLTFQHKVDNPMRTRTRNEEYPAIAGLAVMGKPALPALMKIIATSPSDFARENAMYALMTIYDRQPEAGLDLLQKAADTEQDYVAVQHLREGAAKAEAIWCKYRTCTNPPK